MPRLLFPSIALLASAASAQNHLLWRDVPTTGVGWLTGAGVYSNGDLVAVGQSVPPGSPYRGITVRYSPQGVRLLTQHAGTASANSWRDVAVATGDVLQSIGTAVRPAPGPTNFTWLGFAGGQEQEWMPGGDGRSIVSLSATEFLFQTSAVAAAKFNGNTVVWSNSAGFQPAYLSYLAAGAGGVAFAAGTTPAGPAVRRIRPDGTTDWTVQLPNTEPLYANNAFLGGLLVDGQGGVFVAGCVSNLGTYLDVAIAKLDAVTGQILWMHTTDGGLGLTDSAMGLARAANGDLYLFAMVPTDAAGHNRVLVQRYRDDGTLLGQRFGSEPGTNWWYAAGILVGEDVWAYGSGGGMASPGHYAGFVMRCDLGLTRSEMHIEDVGTSQGGIFDGRLGPGRTMYAVGQATGPTGWPTGLVMRIGSNSVATCFGDGSGTTCPCGNNSPPASRAGCLNSLGSAGRLDEDGFASISADTFVLEGSGMPDSSALYFQGSTLAGGGAGITFGDGLRCASGSTPRLGIRRNVGGSSHYPGPGDPSVSFQGAIGAPGTRAYQVWYRNSASFCTPQAFNLTNALLTTWEP